MQYEVFINLNPATPAQFKVYAYKRKELAEKLLQCAHHLKLSAFVIYRRIS